MNRKNTYAINRILNIGVVCGALLTGTTIASDFDVVTQESDLELPVTKVHLDELTPNTIEALVNESSNIVIGEIVSVKSASRIYHSGTEDRDRSYYEQVMLNFETKEILKGEDVSPSVRWTAYELERKKKGKRKKKADRRKYKRVKRIEIADMIINRSNIGDRYVLFLEPVGGKLQTIGFINGIQPVDHSGNLLPRNSRTRSNSSNRSSNANAAAGGNDHSLFARHRGKNVGTLLGLTN